jgi:hypothetical protein
MSEEPTPVAGTPTSPGEEVRRRILAKLVSKGGGMPLCPICHQRAFSIGPYVQLAAGIQAFNMNLGRTLPCTSLLCNTCGNVLLVSLILLGFTPDELKTMDLPEYTDANIDG